MGNAMSILHVMGVGKSFSGLKALNDVNLTISVEQNAIAALHLSDRAIILDMEGSCSTVQHAR